MIYVNETRSLLASGKPENKELTAKAVVTEVKAEAPKPKKKKKTK